MNFKQLFESQAKLDEKVFKKAKVEEGQTVRQRLLALQVELSELANELGTFKYWKVSHKMNQQACKEEWADVLHFALSVGLAYGHKVKESDLFDTHIKTKEDLHEAILIMNTRITKLHSRFVYLDFLSELIAIGKYLGMNKGTMVTEYMKKNKKNYERIVSGY